MRALLALLLFAGPLLGQAPNGWAPIENGWAEIQVAPPTGTVTTTSTLVSGRVALSSGASSLTDDAGLTRTGTGTGFRLGIGTDVFLSRVSAGLLLVEDGSGNARDVQARTGYFGTSVVTPVVSGGAGDITTDGTTYNIFKTGGVMRGYFDSTNFYLSSTGMLADGRILTATGTVSPYLVSGVGKSGTNVAGTNNTIQAEPGTGSATGSSIIFQTPTATTSGTDAQTQATRLTLSEPAVIAAVPVRLAGYTVATLPAGTVGDTAYVTDATAPTYLGALVGGGAVTTPVFYNGTAWVSH